jgi:NAD(P)-dependent dehydrogenase (short-subunit alcohol dehydrogenase family)
MSEAQPNPLFDLTGRSVIVTGGGTGIGKVYSTALAGAGASVVIADGIVRVNRLERRQASD